MNHQSLGLLGALGTLSELMSRGRYDAEPVAMSSQVLMVVNLAIGAYLILSLAFASDRNGTAHWRHLGIIAAVYVAVEILASIAAGRSIHRSLVFGATTGALEFAVFYVIGTIASWIVELFRSDPIRTDVENGPKKQTR